ncbi:hypothetical protein [Comamonas sp. JC664]|uniref:hypothetical protein n=1 Tax=Comamonas sp. JC664 TaxID=2801917 RepID=UPI00361AA727
MLSVLAHPACLLGWTALAMLWPGAADSLNNGARMAFRKFSTPMPRPPPTTARPLPASMPTRPSSTPPWAWQC